MKYIRRAGIVLLVCLMAMVSVGADQRVINVLNTPQKCPILLYHHFTDDIPDNYSTMTSAEKFEDDIRRIVENGYQVISLEEMYECMRSGISLPPKSVVITMDDGYESNYTIAYPVLKKYNVKASIFVNNDLMGKISIHGFPHFSWEQAREMEESGLVKVYSHGYTHTDFDKMSPEELREGIKNSLREIDENLGKRKLKVVAYVGGAYSKEAFEVVYQAGAELQMLVGYDTNDKSISKYSFFPRFTVFYTTDVIQILDRYYLEQK